MRISLDLDLTTEVLSRIMRVPSFLRLLIGGTNKQKSGHSANTIFDQVTNTRNLTPPSLHEVDQAAENKKKDQYLKQLYGRLSAVDSEFKNQNQVLADAYQQLSKDKDRDVQFALRQVNEIIKAFKAGGLTDKKREELSLNLEHCEQTILDLQNTSNRTREQLKQGLRIRVSQLAWEARSESLIFNSARALQDSTPAQSFNEFKDQVEEIRKSTDQLNKLLDQHEHERLDGFTLMTDPISDRQRLLLAIVDEYEKLYKQLDLSDKVSLTKFNHYLNAALQDIAEAFEEYSFGQLDIESWLNTPEGKANFEDFFNDLRTLIWKA